LASIQAGKQLKKVDDEELARSREASQAESGGDMADVIARALMARRVNLKEEEVTELSSDSDWDD